MHCRPTEQHDQEDKTQFSCCSSGVCQRKQSMNFCAGVAVIVQRFNNQYRTLKLWSASSPDAQLFADMVGVATKSVPNMWLSPDNGVGVPIAANIDTELALEKFAGLLDESTTYDVSIVNCPCAVIAQTGELVLYALIENYFCRCMCGKSL